MKTAEEILREYVEFNDINGNDTVELLPLTIIDIMEEYNQQFIKKYVDIQPLIDRRDKLQKEYEYFLHKNNSSLKFSDSIEYYYKSIPSKLIELDYILEYLY